MPVFFLHQTNVKAYGSVTDGMWFSSLFFAHTFTNIYGAQRTATAKLCFDYKTYDHIMV